jgi:hypothetical protein
MDADDRRPPYFHIVAPDFQALAPIAVIASDARPADIAEALEWAREHRESLALKWPNSTNEYDSCRKPCRASPPLRRATSF